MALPLVIGGAALALPLIMKLIGKAAAKGGAALAPRLTGAAFPAMATAPTLASRALTGAGQSMQAGGQRAGSFMAGAAIPGGILLGRGLQGASIGAGAGIEALGNLPRAMSSTTQAQRERFGKTPSDSLAEIVSGVGRAAGIGVSAVGNAVGSTIGDMSNQARLAKLNQDLHNRTMQQAQEIQGLNLRPSDANLLGRTISAQGRAK
jgi:hypothetical protein